MGTYTLRVPASRVGYVPDAQGGLPPGPHVQYVLATRTGLGRWVRTAYCGNPGSGALRLIDFEYGGSNYRGFDLATHLSHWAGGASDGRYTDAAFPRGAALRGFLAAYAAHAAGSVTPDALADEVRLATPLVHAVWGLWAVCSLPEGGETRPFSHIEYAERRLAAFETSLLRSASSS